MSPSEDEFKELDSKINDLESSINDINKDMKGIIVSDPKFSKK